MTPEQRGRLERIEKFPLVGAEADVLFTKKLAQQNGWSIRQAVAAIKEYRRFLFLAMAAGHPVSPSDSVDQVWHLHLMYTTEYWQVFCPEALGRPFHHHPSAGGATERAKFEDWYAATLASYREFFQEAPPVEFWPKVEAKAQIDLRTHRRVDTSEHWIVRKPAALRNHVVRPALTFVIVLLVLLLGAGCSDHGDVPPWSMNGPDFLKFFVGLLVTCWTTAYFIRRSRRGPLPHPDEPLPHLTVNEVAYLGGGALRLMQSALGRLATLKAIHIDDSTKAVIKVDDWPGKDELDQTLLRHVKGQKLRELQEELLPVLERQGDRLKRLGILIPDSAQRDLIVLPTLIAILPLLVGGIKFCIGLWRGRPVEILVFLLIVALVVAVGFCRKGFRTRKGDALLKALQKEHESVKGDLRNGGGLEQAILVGLAVALFGTDTLAGTPLSALRGSLGSDSGASGCGSGCGGGGCGGGGCGGGGCGGCGG